MTQEEYSQLDSDFAHCAGANCKETDQCLHHTVYGMLGVNHNPTYMVVNPAIITGRQPCPLFIPDRHERYAWGISHIFDNVRAADLRAAKHGVKACFGSSTFYHVKEQLRAITEEEQQAVRQVFAELGYDGAAIEFDRYEECYPSLMRIKRYK